MLYVAFILAIPAAVQQEPSQDDIRTLVDKLQSKSIEEREEATRQLEAVGT